MSAEINHDNKCDYNNRVINEFNPFCNEFGH